MSNRRSDVRKKIAEKVDATITYVDSSSSAREGTITDMSSQGIFLKTSNSLIKDSYVGMKLNTQEILGRQLWAQGLVVRIGKDGVGIRFTYVEPDIIKML